MHDIHPSLLRVDEDICRSADAQTLESVARGYRCGQAAVRKHKRHDVIGDMGCVGGGSPDPNQTTFLWTNSGGPRTVTRYSGVEYRNRTPAGRNSIE